MKNNKQFFLITLLSLVFSFLTAAAHAKTEFNEEEKKLLKARQTHSVRIYPDIITNLRMSRTKKQLKYIMLKIDLIALTEKDMNTVESYMPLIKDRLLILIHKLSQNNFANQERRASFKSKVKKVVNAALFAEIKKNLVTEVIVQKLTIE